MKCIVVLAICLLLSACGGHSDPADVARSYWDAVKAGDQAAVDQWIIHEQAPVSGAGTSETRFDGDKVEEIRFAEALVDGDHARVATMILPTIDAAEASPELGDITFDTELLKVGGEWKVDRQSTEKNMVGAIFATAMGAMGQAFSDGMKEAMEGVGEALAEGLAQGMQSMAEGLSEGLEDLGESVNQMTEKDSLSEQIPSVYQPPVVLPAQVGGSIRGNRVELTSAEWGNTLAIYAGDGWGSNPSLLLFLFLDKGEIPASRTITVGADEGGYSNPHVHYRWRDPETGNIETEVAINNYNLELTLGEAVNKRVPGRIRFSIPDEKTDVAGVFEIELLE